MALFKAEEEVARELGTVDEYELAVEEEESRRKDSAGDENREPTTVKIEWRGGGKNVFLAGAGDDWKGRLEMERQ